MSWELAEELLRKYDVPVPRYTSYPTVPHWTNTPTSQDWISGLKKAFLEETHKNSLPWSLYVHIPFCESLCTFCACNTTITKNHGLEEEYIENLLKEWDFYRSQVPDLCSHPLIQFHYGGGTPTFLSPKNLQSLTQRILNHVRVDTDRFEGSIEVDPRRTSSEHLQSVFDLGFKRLSMGVQDFNREVQLMVNRLQPFSLTRDLTQEARKIGYKSINFDLIYGLPKQSLSLMEKTIDKTIELRPDRIALYSLAFVPWMKPQQRRFKDSDLPKGQQKRKLYEVSRRRLLEAGYLEIGMDHFALPEDDLSKAMKNFTLHRNFMGYTSGRTKILLGLGVSSISESPFCFHQNQKVFPLYQKKVQSEGVPTLRGHVLSEEDRKQRQKILGLITRWEVTLESEEEEKEVRLFLQHMIQDELVEIKNSKLYVLDRGRAFLRNACMAFDKKIQNQSFQKKKVFSQSI